MAGAVDTGHGLCAGHASGREVACRERSSVSARERRSGARAIGDGGGVIPCRGGGQRRTGIGASSNDGQLANNIKVVGEKCRAVQGEGWDRGGAKLLHPLCFWNWFHRCNRL